MDTTSFSTIALISLLGAMSPGPDFAIVTKNSMTGSFRAGFLTALGVSTALLVHVSYCLLGVAILLDESPLLFHTVKYLGSAYLFYLGVMLLKENTSVEGSAKDRPQRRTRQNAFLSGFLCNLLNPKATLFVLSLFTQFIHPTMGFWQKAFLGSVIAIVGCIWFIFLSFLITHRHLQRHFARFQVIICKVMGVALCLLSLYVAFLSS